MSEHQTSPKSTISISNNQFKELAARGAKARNAKLTPEQRSEISRRAGLSKGKKGLNKASNEGTLKIGNANLDCYVVSKGLEKIRIFSAHGIRNAFGLSQPNAKKLKISKDALLPTFLSSNNLRPYVSNILDDRLELIEFVNKTGQKVQGIPAILLPEICQIYISAHQDGKIHLNQIPIAIMASTILTALAKTGVIALVDEVSGYQEERARDELQTLLKSFISEDLLKWTQRFPHQFFREVYKIHGWPYKPGQNKHPQCLGNFINKYVYDAISPDVKEELQSKNPIIYENGKRAVAHHQYLTEEVGIPSLDKHLIQCIGLLKASRSKEEFKDLFFRVFPETKKDSE